MGDSVLGSKDAYDHFLPEAEKLTEEQLFEFRIDPQLALHNVQVGAQAVLEHKDQIKKELPGVKTAEISELSWLAQGVVFAALQVNRDAGSDGTIAELVSRAYAVRKRLLTSAVALADAEILPQADVTAIQKGRGHIDAANDCVALAALFEKHAAAVKGKSPVTAADLSEASTVGSQLQTLLKPRQARRAATPAEVAAAADRRDRLWTLLVQRHDRLWRVGAWLFGHDVDEHVPPLQARVLGPRKSAPTPPTSTPTPPAAA